MIAGVIAQEPRVPTRGTILFGAFLDNESVVTPIISTDHDQLLSPNRVVDSTENVFPGVDLPHTLTPNASLDLPVLDFDLIFSVRQIAADQRLISLFLYSATDIVLAPDIRVPGHLLPPLHVGDDDVVFPTPLVLDRGMLRQVELHLDVDVIPGSEIVAPLTLRAGLVVDPDDDFSVHRPLVRAGIGPPFYLPDDYIPHLISTAFYRASLVFDNARPVTPIAILDSSDGVTIGNDKLTATRFTYGSVAGARSNLTQSRSKFYFEVTIVHIGGSNDGIGVMMSTATYSNMANHSSCSGVFQAGGVVFSNNSRYQFQLGNLWHQDVIGCAIDLDNRRAWFRKNGGRWNGLLFGVEIPSYPVDPEQNLGGVTVADGDFAPACIFNGGSPGDEMRFNFVGPFLSMPAGFDLWQTPSPFPASQTADRFGEVEIATPTTFDYAPTAAAVTNNGLTVTKTGSYLGDAAGFSSAGQNYGKFYFEVMVNSTHGEYDHVGLVTQNTNAHFMQNGATIVYCNGGGIYTMFGQTGKTLGRSLVAGDVVGLAIDLTYQTAKYGGKVWFRLNGGSWNNDTTLVASPVTGAGGLNVNGMNFNTMWYPAVGFNGTSGTNGDQFTGNFGQSPYFSPAPSGYGVWPSTWLNVITGINSGDPQSTADDAFPVPFVDLKDKFLVHNAPHNEPDAIYGGISFGGNLFFNPTQVVPSDDDIKPGGNYAFFGTNSPNVTLANRGLTATLASSVNNTGAKSTHYQSGPLTKFYFEMRGASIRSADCAGLMSLAGTYSLMVNNGTQCVAVFASTGNIYSNNGSAGKSVGAVASGTTLCFAIDLQFRKGWIRVAGGPWNNDATANPATNVGGFNVGSGAFAPAVGFGGGGQAVNDQWIANFGGLPFAASVPAGFIAGWPGSSDLALVTVDGIVDDRADVERIHAPLIQNAIQILSHPTAPLSPHGDDSVKQAKFPSGVPATLDGAAVDVTMSNGNKTATRSAVIASAAGARSATQKVYGKYYFEVTVNKTTGANDTAALMQASAAYSDLIVNTWSSFMVRLATGAIYGGNISTGYSVGPVVAGDVLGFAVYLDAQAPSWAHGWVSKNGGPWNGNATADPITDVGGPIFATNMAHTPAVAFGGTGTAVNDAMTLNCGPNFASANANPAGYNDWQVIQPSTVASFDGVASNVALTNNNLTATHTNTTNNSGVRSLSLKGSGKYYFEVAATNVHGNFDCAGLMTSTGAFADFVTSGTNCFAVYKGTGNIYGNNIYSNKTLGAIAIGDILCFAIDLTARKGWVRANGGLWNNEAISLQNPATGLGGVALAPTNFSPAVGFGGAGTAANDTMTGNFGPSGFAYTVPSGGFGAWTVASEPTALATIDGLASNTTVSGGGLIVTKTNTSDGGARSTSPKSSGKVYFEATLGQMRGSSDGIGLLTPAGTFTDQRNGLNCISVFTNFNTGAIYAGNGSAGTINVDLLTGDVLCLAIDFDARRAWFRKNGQALWNNTSGADPSTGVSGIAIPAGVYTPSVCMANTGTVAGDSVTFNFGQSAYVATVPTGFLNWTA